MANEACLTKEPKGLSYFGKYLSIWVLLCIAGGIILGKLATSTMLFGLSSVAVLATVVGVLIKVTVMLMLVKICLKNKKLVCS